MSAHHVQRPEDLGADRFRHTVVVFYRRNGLLITDRQVVHGTTRYDVAELTGAVQATGPLHPGARAGALIGAANGVVLGTSATAVGSAAIWFLTVVAVLVPWGVAAAYALRWPRELRLLVDHRGRQVTLLRTRDSTEFGQVARALQRAMEAAAQVG